jgi:TfoX/Sxy family transcriptional regulator of competence genes
MGLLLRAKPELASTHSLTFKNVFGAVGGYVDGVIFASSGSFGVALRLPPGTLAKLFLKADVVPLRYFPRGRVKKQYAVLPDRILSDERGFQALLDESVAFAAELGAKA